MSLARAFREAAKAAFRAAGDVKISATFKKSSGSSYNPTTGVVTESLAATTLDIIRVETSSEDKMGEHLPDVSGLYLILGSDISGVTPESGDILTVEGHDKTIIDVVTDPIKAVWEVGT